GKFKERLASPAEKSKIVSEMKEKLSRSKQGSYAYAMIAEYKHDPSLNGLNIVEAARKIRGSDSIDDQIEMVLEIQKNGGARGVFHSISEEDLRKFLAHANTMIASDSGVRKFQQGVPH